MSPRGLEHGAAYRRRRPETTALHRAVRRHMSTFLDRVSEAPGEPDLPAHVRGELERYLRCGLLSEGFVRVYCATCKAARWVDRLLLPVSWRQWVLTVPFELRLLAKRNGSPAVENALSVSFSRKTSKVRIRTCPSFRPMLTVA